MNSDQEKRIVHYLLGQLPEPEQAELEARYLADDDCFAELLAIEDELRDAYARGELSAPDREAFERRLLASSQQARKQEFARTLSQHVVEPSRLTAHRAAAAGKWKSWFPFLATKPRVALIPLFSLLILVAAGWWLTHGRGRQLATIPTALPSTSQSTSGQAPGQRQTSAERSTFAFVLNPGLFRGPGRAQNSLVIPPGVSQIRLGAWVEGDYPNYHVVVQTAENNRIWSKDNLKAQSASGGKRVFIEIPRNLLQPGDYILAVRGVPSTGTSQTVAEYAFRVEKR